MRSQIQVIFTSTNVKKLSIFPFSRLIFTIFDSLIAEQIAAYFSIILLTIWQIHVFYCDYFIPGWKPNSSFSTHWITGFVAQQIVLWFIVNILMMLYRAYLDFQQCCFVWSDLLRNTAGSLSNLRIYILSAQAPVKQPSERTELKIRRSLGSHWLLQWHGVLACLEEKEILDKLILDIQ